MTGIAEKRSSLLLEKQPVSKKDTMAFQPAQTTSNILMVRPAHFSFNEETAGSNAFQSNDATQPATEISQKAVAEFDAFVERLRLAGVNVIVVQDTDKPVKPDAVFPNNWVTFHEDGKIVTYPMYATVRRLERREDILKNIQSEYRVEKKIHLEEYENIGQYLEGTGSMIFDRTNKIAYACLSPRTNLVLLKRFCKLTGYEPVAFHAVDGEGKEIYHTNVMMALGETFVVICLETVEDDEEAAELLQKFAETHKEIIEITMEQMMAFAGNMLQVRNAAGDTYLVMSEQAYRSLTETQVQQIQKHTNILFSPIPTIETFGGGSVRCMMAEVFLPKK